MTLPAAGVEHDLVGVARLRREVALEQVGRALGLGAAAARSCWCSWCPTAPETPSAAISSDDPADHSAPAVPGGPLRATRATIPSLSLRCCGRAQGRSPSAVYLSCEQFAVRILARCKLAHPANASGTTGNKRSDGRERPRGALLGCSGRRFAASSPRAPPPELREAAARGSLGPRHVPALLAVAAAEPLSVSELSRRLGLGLSTTSTLVGELSRAGLLERYEDDADRRRTIVRLHDDYREVIGSWRRAVARAAARDARATLAAGARPVHGGLAHAARGSDPHGADRRRGLQWISGGPGRERGGRAGSRDS